MSDKEKKKDPTTNEVMEALTKLREEVAKSNPDQEVITKMNGILDAQEVTNQKVLADQKTADEKAIEQKERIDALEVEVARRAQEPGKSNYKESDEYKALEGFVKQGDSVLFTPEVKALLRTDSDVSGGFLVPVEMDNVITKKITEISDIRSIARVRTIAGKTLNVPVRATNLTAQYEGEAEQGTDDTETYQNESLTAFRQSVTVPITQDMLMDAAFDMESEIMTDAGEAFAQGEGLNFVNGDGVKKPAGFVANSVIQAAARESAASGVIDATDVILLTGDLKTGYNPVYVMNRTTLAFLRTLKSTTGSFLWQPGMNGPVANTLNGFPYLLAQDMPDIASSAFPVAFGDFRRGYTIVDRTGMSVVRDEVTQKKKAIIEFTINRWNYGQVTLAEAITLLKVKA